MKTILRRFTVLVIGLQLSTCSGSPDGRSSSSPSAGEEKPIEQPADVAGGFGLYDSEVVCEPVPELDSVQNSFKLGCKVVDSANNIINIPESAPIDLAFSTNAKVIKSEKAPAESQFQWIFTFALSDQVESSASEEVEAEVLATVRAKPGRPEFEGEIKAVFRVNGRQRNASKSQDVTFNSDMLSRRDSNSQNSQSTSSTGGRSSAQNSLTSNVLITCRGGSNSACDDDVFALKNCELFSKADLAVFGSQNCEGEPLRQLGTQSAGSLPDIIIGLRAFRASERTIFIEAKAGDRRICRRVSMIPRSCFRN